MKKLGKSLLDVAACGVGIAGIAVAVNDLNKDLDNNRYFNVLLNIILAGLGATTIKTIIFER